MTVNERVRFEFADPEVAGRPRTRFELVKPAAGWILDRRRSSFQLHLDGDASPVAAQFQDVRRTVRFDETNPSSSLIGVELDIMPTGRQDASSPDRERLNDAFRQEGEGLALVFWTRNIEVLGEGRFQVQGSITIPGASHEIELQVMETGQGQDRSGTRRVHYWAWTRFKAAEFGPRWDQVLQALHAEKADVIDVVMEVELMENHQG